MIEPTISLHSEQLGETTIIRIHGNMDVHNTHAIEKELIQMLEKATKSVVYDLKDVAYVSSAGLRILISSLKFCQEKGMKIALAGLRPAVEKVFEVVGMQTIFAVYPDLDSALA